MGPVTIEDVKNLMDSGLGPCVSVYASQQPGYPDCRGNAKELLHLLVLAETRLKELNVEPAQIVSMLQPGFNLARGRKLDEAGGNMGLVLFLAPGFVREWQLPFECRSAVDVGNAFRIAPLVRLTHDPQQIRLVALCANRFRYFECSRSTIRELDLPSANLRSFQEFEGDILQDRTPRFQTSAGAAGTTHVIHGQTNFKDETKNQLHRYVRAVAEAVAGSMPDRLRSVVLMATEELHSSFTAAIHSKGISTVGIHASPAHLSDAQIHEQVLAAIDAEGHGAIRAAFTRYDSAMETHQALSELEKIVPAACEGQVDTLLAAYDERVWGIYEARSRQALIMPPTAQAETIDLLELAVRETLRHAGHVCVVPRSSVPGQVTAAAALRWTDAGREAKDRTFAVTE